MQYKTAIFRAVAVLAITVAICPKDAHAWQSDNGDGTFTNPILYADYPDPDIIRVGEDFYFASTTFVNSPGLSILHSKDLVNWKILGHVVERLNGRKEYDLSGGVAYRSGVFAPSLRFHDGVFYVAVTPNGQNTRIYHSKDPQGPWKSIELGESAFDPALFIEKDGQAYIATSGGWDGTVTLLSLSDDLKHVKSRQKIHYIKGAEGSKLVKRGEWYYLFNAIPSRFGMTVSRSKSLFGSWETRNQIDGNTGGHQGAIVDLPNGNWYGFVHRDSGAIGRMTQISPIFWEDDWPVWGTPEDRMRVPNKAKKPVLGYPTQQPATSDDFHSSKLGQQWQWNHNPDNTRWTLTERPGFLRLKPTKATEFWTAKNTLTQKGQGPWSSGQVKFDLQNMKPGDVCGFGTHGKFNGHIAVQCDAGGDLRLSMDVIEDTVDGLKVDHRVVSKPLQQKEISLRTEMDFTANQATCSYSLDGQSWQKFGGPFPMAYDWRTGTFQGQKYAIFCYNKNPGDGFVDVDSFLFRDKRPSTAVRPAVFSDFSYSGQDTNSTGKLGQGEFRNPILSGFHPDPSICRVGKDYYLINSTFEYFPGIPLFHSTDLVNWKQLGHVIDRPDQLDYKAPQTSGGLFAPAISWHEGLFYVVCTMIEGPGNFVVTANNPAGPWSDPIPLDFHGIDPSLFFDDDGRAWMLNNGAPEGEPLYDGHRAIWIQEFDYAKKQMTGPRKLLVNGGVDLKEKPVWIEGPHLYKRAGWYYLCCAEGGTSSHHSQVIFRSKHVTGPYKPWDGNPILTQRSLSGSTPGAVTCTGHADLEIGPDGNWWAVFLGVRPYGDGVSPMGRETFLLPVEWPEGGWPVILPEGKRVPLVGKSPQQTASQTASSTPRNGSFTWTDRFTKQQLSPAWIMLRAPQEAWWKVDPTAEHLELAPRPERLTGAGNPSYLARRVQHSTYSASIVLDASLSAGVSAGLALYMNEKHHYFLAVQRQGDQAHLFVERVKGGVTEEVASVDISIGQQVGLRVVADHGTCAFQYQTNGNDWKTIVKDDGSTVISFSVPDGLFLGATVGPHARTEE